MTDSSESPEMAATILALQAFLEAWDQLSDPEKLQHGLVLTATSGGHAAVKAGREHRYPPRTTHHTAGQGDPWEDRKVAVEALKEVLGVLTSTVANEDRGLALWMVEGKARECLAALRELPEPDLPVISEEDLYGGET